MHHGARVQPRSDTPRQTGAIKRSRGSEATVAPNEFSPVARDRLAIEFPGHEGDVRAVLDVERVACEHRTCVRVTLRDNVLRRHVAVRPEYPLDVIGDDQLDRFRSGVLQLQQ